jgi:tetratricopeptide (TPR) repeat protein
VHKQLMEAQTLLEKKQYTKAVAVLQTVAMQKTLTPYETAIAQQTLAHAYVAIDKLDDAASAFRASLASQGFAHQQARGVEYNLAQILIGAERYAEGAKVLEAWLAQEREQEPKPEIFVLLAQVYAQLKRYPDVERHIRQAMRHTSELREDWYRLLLVAYFEQNKFQQAAAVLKQLVAQLPDTKTYWLQLSQVYHQTKEERQAAAVLRLAYEMNILEGQEILQLVQYYWHLDLPYTAARILEESLAAKTVSQTSTHLDLPYTAARILEESLAAKTVSQTSTHQDLLISCWLQAKAYQRALDAINRFAQTASESQVGVLIVRKGEILAQLERWDEAAQVLEAGLHRGGLPDTGRAYLRLGIAHHQSGKAAESKSTFRKAASYANVTKQAKQWLRMIVRAQNKGRVFRPDSPGRHPG